MLFPLTLVYFVVSVSVLRCSPCLLDAKCILMFGGGEVHVEPLLSELARHFTIMAS